MKDYIFDYYYGNEAEQFTFFRIPKLLFTNDKFALLSIEAKLLYGMMLDRMGLSMKNRWLDENDCVYIIFTVKEMMDTMNCGEQKVSKMLKELDSKSGIGLIERKRRGLGKADIIYVKNFAEKFVNPNTDGSRYEDTFSDTDENELMIADDTEELVALTPCSDSENQSSETVSSSCAEICNEAYWENLACEYGDCEVFDSGVEDILADDIAMQHAENGDKSTALSENENHDSGTVKITVQEPPKSHFKSRENHGSRTSKIMVQEPPKSWFKNLENHGSRTMEITVQEPRNSMVNNNDINNTNYSYTDNSDKYNSDINPIHQSGTGMPIRLTMKQDLMDDRIKYKTQIYKNIDYNIIKSRYDIKRLDGMIEIMLDAICSKKDTLIVAGDEKPQKLVRDTLLKLNEMHIEYVFDCLEKNVTQIHNIKAYLLAVLYNSVATIGDYYAAEVNCDRMNGGF